MPINEEITGTGVSAVANPAAATSDIVIEPGGLGDVWLEQQVPGGQWLPITKRAGSYVINTPDQSVSYRFRGKLSSGTVRVFFGA
jgi:hypothetical protein